MVTNFVVSIVLVIYNHVLGNFGFQAIAAFGICFRVTGLATMVLFGVSAGLMPIVGYNLGAGSFNDYGNRSPSRRDLCCFRGFRDHPGNCFLPRSSLFFQRSPFNRHCHTGVTHPCRSPDLFRSHHHLRQHVHWTRQGTLAMIILFHPGYSGLCSVTDYPTFILGNHRSLDGIAPGELH